MFQVDRSGDNRLDITFGGKINAEEMTAALDTLTAHAEGIENGQMLFEITDYQLPTLGGVMVELSRMPQMFSFIAKFNKAAVLADQHWLKAISELEGKLIPHLEIKAFGRDEKTKADLWLQSR